MVMKLGNIAGEKFVESLGSLMRLKGVPAKTMFQIRSIAKTVAEEATKYEEVRKQLIEEFSTNEDGVVKIKADSIGVFNEKIRELYNLEVGLKEIKFSDLGESPDLTSENLFHLEFIVE